MALAPARTNVKVAGLSEWAIKDTARPDVGYAVIPFIRQGKVEIKTLETKDSQGRPVPFAFELAVTAQFPAVRTTANFMKLLDAMGTKLIDHRITLVNGQIISSKPGVSTPSPTGFGLKWKLVSDKDMDGDMFVELTASRRLTATEYTQVLTSANADATGPDAADTFYGFGSLVRTDIVPAGFSKVEVGAADAGTYADVISNIRMGKMTAELLTTKDSRGQDYGFAIKIDVEVEGMETAEAELLKWDDIALRANECKVTFVNGLTCSLPHQLGITTSITVDKDMEDIGVIKVMGSGIITTSAWDALWSA